MSGEGAQSSARRPELDWVRLIAFAGLMAYHLSQLYTNFPWDLGSEGQPGLALFHAALSPWRMALLFTLSGMATAFMAASTTPEALWTRRARQLLGPVLLGLVLLAPIEIYWVLKAKFAYDESFPTFLRGYFSPSHSVVLDGTRYGLPVFLYLWYLAYLALYTLLLAAVIKRAPRFMERVTEAIGRRAGGPGLIVWPLVILMLLRTLLYPLGTPGGPIDELYRHIAFFGLFVFGFVVGRREAVWDAFVRYRWIALAMAVGGFAVFGYYTLADGRGDGGLAEARHPVLHLIRPVEVWGAICAVFGFARLHLRRANPLLKYLSRGVLTFYVLHHPVMLVTAALLRPVRLPAGAEACAVLLVTATACVGTYELLRRCGLLAPAVWPRRKTADAAA